MLDFEKLLNYFFKNSTKIYLIAANLVLVVFGIWFSNVGLLPFANFGDFAFFAMLALILAIYRPSWTFAFFVGTLILENVNLAPKELGIAIRPYQFFGFITIVSLLVQIYSKRLAFSLPKFRWFDGLVLLFAAGGFLSAFGSINRAMSFKQAVVALSFVALYFLVRIYVQSWQDLKRVAPFFLSSAFVLMIYGIWQNIRFIAGTDSFEVMPGRPNGTFTEADWLGIFVTFVLAVLLTILYALNRNHVKDNDIQIFKKVGVYIFIIFTVIVLILTVSRSAWIGALIVLLGYLKVILFYGGEDEDLKSKAKTFLREFFGLLKKPWHWKKFFQETVTIFLIFIAAIGIIFVFNLTNFQLGSRAVSTGGLQKITIACQDGSGNVPEKISGVMELENYKCRHINLEEIENEKASGMVIEEVYRPDPNVNIRAEIYQKSIAEIKNNPFWGIGWGSIGQILGQDERGTGLNASNIFLEIWLGAGLVGIISFVILLGYLWVEAVRKLLKAKSLETGMVFVLLGLFAIVIPNLFNSGIFLGFVWCYLAAAVGLLSSETE